MWDLKPLEIVVCIKQVPDPRHLSKIIVDPATMTIRREGIPAVINPLDEHALEEGLRIRDRCGGKVTVLSMGPRQAERACREALAMGADEAILLCDGKLAGSDTLATAYALSQAVKKLGVFDLILCGNETVDGSTAQVPAQLADFLGIPHVTRVNKIEFIGEERLRVERTIEYGRMIIEVELRSVLAVTRRINTPRLPTAQGISRGYEREVRVWTAADIEADEERIGLGGSPTKVIEVFTPDIGRRGEILRGTPEEAARSLVERLHQLGII